MKITLEVLSIFFISVLFLFQTTNKNSNKIKTNEVEFSSEINHRLIKNIDCNATPIIIVKKD